MDRNEHLEWAKERAVREASENGGVEAWSSFVSDMQKHEELKEHIAIELGTMTLGMNHFNTVETIKFIAGFN